MKNIFKLPIIILLFLLTSPVMAFEPIDRNAEDCDDFQYIYRICEDQELKYIKAYSESLKTGKKLLVVFGYDKCPWCNSLYQLLHGEDFLTTTGLNEKYVVVELGVLTPGEQEMPDGLKVLAQLKDYAGEPDKVAAYPFFAFVNPTNMNTILSYMGPFRYPKTHNNHPGIDPQKLDSVLLDIYKQL